MHRKLILSSAVAAVIGLVTACGGGDSTTVTGIGGTGITASGPITGFGSVIVNGVKFETDSSSFSIDDSSTGVSELDLEIGMVVTVRGTVNDDGVTGVADSIDFDSELEGPVGTGSIVDNVTTKTFTVMGIPVEISSTDTVFGDFITFDTLDDTMLVEVSGLVNSDGTLIATYIEAEDDPYDAINDNVEAVGVIDNLDTGAGIFDLILSTGTIEVKYDGTTDVTDLPGGAPENGQRVEVEGLLENGNNAPFVIVAEEIKSESFDDGDDADDDDNDVNLKGYITDFVDNSNFVVSGQAVNAATALLEPTNLTLGDGVLVEVEGPIVNGVLIADTVHEED